MDKSEIIKNEKGFEFKLESQLQDWLSKRLPKITDNYWEEIVLSNLSAIQRQNINAAGLTKVNELDLAALLRIIDRNWFVITNSFFINNKDRIKVQDMKEVRNTWAHISATAITKDKVLHDLQIIFDLMCAFDASSANTREIEQYLLEIEHLDFDAEDKDQGKVKPEKDKFAAPSVENADSDEIKVGSVVTLASDNSVVGAVIGINGQQYTVLVGTTPRTFYAEQLVLQAPAKKNKQISINRVRAALTAYQINNPSSSSLYSLNAARIDFVPYQFRPALKMIKADTPRILVADDVGVGKTIEAGLILKELEARSSINSVLIICPRPLVAERKWELEMKRFDENFVQFDGKMLANAIQETDLDGEWPENHSKAVIPYSLFNEDSIEGTKSTSDKKKKTLGLNELDPLPHFDLVIVDEAHNIRNPKTYAYQGVELFCRNADAVVFLTATPLQNSNNDLYTLLNLLRPDVVIDPDYFETMSEPNRYINSLLRIIRNQHEEWQNEAKNELTNILGTTWGRSVIQHNPNFAKVYDFVNKDAVSREEKIEALSMVESLHSFNQMITRTRRRDIEDLCIRRTNTVRSDFSGVQRELYDCLIEFEQNALTLMHGARSVRFMMCTMMRQASSCIYGLAPYLNDFVQKRLDKIQEDGEMYEFDFEMNDDLGNSLYELADEIDRLTSQLPTVDPKMEKMLEIVREKQNDENNRIIVFSSFRYTLAYIRGILEKEGYRVGQVDGDVPDDERFAMRQRFLLDRKDEDAIDILLFSEVGCEGLDYQFCDTMINYDLPWNPMRIEQRIGRIDRRGQKSDTVKIYNMITKGTIDETIYDRCLNKIGVFEASIGDCSEILGDISEQIMKIMFDPQLTDEERTEKIEQMADNEVRNVQEIQKLEADEKTLYGFDLSDYIQNKDVQEAEADWVSQENLNSLADMFLSDLLGDGEYFRGKSELKTLLLAIDKRKKLLDNLKETQIINSNNATKQWRAYLKSDRPRLSVTFDGGCAKDNRDCTFLTQMHPLMLQAAQYESKQFPCEVGVSVSEDGIPAGDYEFLVYAWQYVGLRPDIKLVAVCENAEIQENILSYMQYATDFKFADADYVSKWDSMDALHHENWQQAKDSYTNEVAEDCLYRLEQLSESNTKREIAFQKEINKYKAQNMDERIIRMKTRQMEKLQEQYEEQVKKTEDIKRKADIHTNLLIRGVLHVE